MKNYALSIAVIGLLAAFFGLLATFFSIVLNLASDTAGAAQSLTIEGAVAAIIALTCGTLTFRKSGGWRFLAIAMIGPAVFVLADCAMRMALLLKAGL